MTPAEIRRIAIHALAVIACTPPRQVFASRKGIVMAAQTHPPKSPGRTVAFRRVDGKVRLEMEWSSGAPNREYFDLPADLQKRAAKMLDNLP